MDNIRSATPEALAFVQAMTDHKAAMLVNPRSALRNHKEACEAAVAALALCSGTGFSGSSTLTPSPLFTGF